jgi:translation initiation factor 2B subunit (eIF-2B alpha/beta/delta family)
MEIAARAIDLVTELVNDDDPAVDVRHVARVLATAHPSMAAIGNAVALHLSPVAAEVASYVSLRGEAVATNERWAADATRLAGVAGRHIPKIILTYSNSSSTRNTFLALKDHLRSVILLEGRQINDGKALGTMLAVAGSP